MAIRYRLRSKVLAFIALLLSIMTLRAQETRSTIQGLILDPTGAAVSGAKVLVTNEATNVAIKTQTDAQGSFAVPFLVPGFYRLNVTAAGFKEQTRAGIELRINDRAQIDVRLNVGDAKEQITVSAEAPLLDTASANLGQVVNSRLVEELPVYDGSPFSLVYLSPDILFTYNGPQASYSQPQIQQNTITQSNFSGTPRGSTEFTLDGIPNTQNSMADYGSGVMNSPPSDIVEQFKVETPFDASSGHTSGSIVNFVLKSGTNRFHGSAFFADRNPDWVANGWFNNRAGTARAAFLYHRWGASLTGPIEIPRIYHGRNRTFFTFGYEQFDNIDVSTPYIQSVPTLAERTGDFSALLAVGPQYQIYNPATIRPAANGRFTLDPFPGNKIPASQISPIGQAIIGHYPTPNLPGTADGTNNFGSFDNGRPSKYTNFIGRVDHNLSDKQRLNARISENFRKDGPYRAYWKDVTSGNVWNGPGKQVALDDVYVISPTMVFNIRYGLNRYEGGHTPLFVGFDAANLGFPPAAAAVLNSGPHFFPTVSTGGVGVALANETVDTYNSLNQSLMAIFTKTRGRHNLKFGTDVRAYQNNVFLPGRASGAFTFDTAYTRGPLDNSAAAPGSLGQGAAALLLGIASSGSIDRNDNQAVTSRYAALYFHDNWRATNRLTLDVGLRWEDEFPETERYNRAVRGFDPNASLSVAGQALANYAAHPDTSLAASLFRVSGGLTYAGVGQSRAFWNNSAKVFAPRFGAAYRAGDRIVLRAGFGIFPIEKGVTAKNLAIQTGFNQATQFIPTQNNGQTFTATLSNPFPNGLLAASGNSQGPNTYVGLGPALYNPLPRTPYETIWSFNIQFRLPANALLQVGYVGNKAVKLQLNHDIDALPDQYLSRLPTRDTATVNYLTQNITNPFAGLLPGTTLNGATIARQQLLRPFPQFTSVTVMDYQGASRYNSLQVRMERRFAKGFTAQGGYAFSKLLESMQYLNPGDPAPSRYISPLDRTHNIQASGVFELPIGRGKPLLPNLNKTVNRLVAGWQTGLIYHFTSGAPLSFANVVLNGDIHDVPLPGDSRSVNRWINTSLFNLVSGQQPANNYRTISPYFAGIRAGYLNMWDMNLMKSVTLHEKYAFQIRAEAFNVFNHPTAWAAVNTTPTSSAFGQVTSMYANARLFQLQLKFRF